MNTRRMNIAVLLSGFATPAHAEIDSVLGYYPFNTGDVWQYRYRCVELSSHCIHNDHPQYDQDSLLHRR
jgi:hypothetical protein